VELKKQGITIDYPLEFPVVTYLGDTRYVDFSQLDYVKASKILIAECTFFADEHTGRADAGRHMHIDEFAGLIKQLENKHIVITHLTQRTSMAEIRKILKQKVDKEYCEKIILLMDSRNRRRN